MKDYIFLFIKSLLLVFVIMMVGFLLISYDVSLAAIKALEGASILTTTLVTLQLIFTKATTGSFRFQPRLQERDIVVQNLSFEEFSAKVKSKLKWKIEEQSSDRVVFRSSMKSLITFGEQVELVRFKDDRDKLQLKVKSKPLLTFVLFDFAKGYKNIQMVEGLA